MHTDEYEISLSRELDVCDSKIREIRRFLAVMEKRYSLDTEMFVQGFHDGRLTGYADDFTLWIDNYEALKRWKALKRQYEELLQRMKI
jgi:hypothetical protein